jgi:hypothetical protein
MQDIGGKTRKEDQDVGWWLVLKCISLREIRWRIIEWIDLAQDRHQWRALVNMLMNLRVPQNAGMFLNSCTTGGFSRRV